MGKKIPVMPGSPEPKIGYRQEHKDGINDTDVNFSCLRHKLNGLFHK